MEQKVQHWRDSNDYRGQYFKKNPGLFGFLWFCSQCGKPLLGKQSVEVDHIIPPSQFANKRRNRKGEIVKNDSFLARAMNREYNTVAICPSCNKKKSDKVGLVTAKGVVAKVIETIIYTVQKGVVLLASGLVWLLYHLGLVTFRALASPFKMKTKIHVKLLVGVLYLVAAYWMFNTLR